jgi:hypothetical protein
MNVITISSKIKEENVADAQAAIEKVARTLQQTQLAGVKWASTKLADGVTFVAFLVLENGGNPLTDNPMSALPAYTELLDKIDQWRAAPPSVEPMTLIGSYRMF